MTLAVLFAILQCGNNQLPVLGRYDVVISKEVQNPGVWEAVWTVMSEMPVELKCKTLEGIVHLLVERYICIDLYMYPCKFQCV